MMKTSDKAILDEFAATVRRRHAEAKLWAFGSRARGTGQADSDLDVCVVLDHVDGETRKAISHCAWEVGFEHDVLITTIVFSKDMFEHGPPSASPLVKGIRQDGVAA